MKIIKIKTKNKRVKLRGLRLSDADFIKKWADNKNIIKYTFVIPPPFDLEKAKDFILKARKDIRDKKAYEFGIELNRTKELIGTINLLNINIKNKNADIGFWLAKSYWGKGLAVEAVELMLEFGFKKLKLERIQARVLDENVRSQKLLEKLGFKLEGKLRKKTFFKKRWYNDLIYGLLKEEWKSTS